MRWFAFSILLLGSILICLGQDMSEEFENPAMQFELGKEHGLSRKSTLSHETLMKIMAGAESGNRDNIYFMGLLKMYGISLQKSEKAALDHFGKAASLGLPEAMTAYGLCAYSGIGMPKDNKVAITWFRKAANAQDTNGYWLLAKMLMEGEGVSTPNHPEAAVYFQMAAKEHVMQAEHHLGIMYEYGLGVEQNFHKAAEYYTRAAEQSYTEATYHLALMHAHGRVGFPQDYRRALPLFEAGAQAGHAPCTYSMGIFKTYGYAMEPNYEQAINWFERAAGMNDPRVSAKAKAAALELQKLLEQASDVNEATLNKYAAMAAEGGPDSEESLYADEGDATPDWFAEADVTAVT